MVQHPTEPETLYQQNHCGIYKTTNAGDEWMDIHGELSSDFGFPIAMDPHHPETVFVIVEKRRAQQPHRRLHGLSHARRRPAVDALTNGLPTGPGVRLGVLRHGMCSDAQSPNGVYVGTEYRPAFHEHR